MELGMWRMFGSGLGQEKKKEEKEERGGDSFPPTLFQQSYEAAPAERRCGPQPN